MVSQILSLAAKAKADIESATTSEAIDDIIKGFLGKNGGLGEILKGIKDLPDDQKKLVGPEANKQKDALLSFAEQKKSALAEAALTAALETSTFDPTMPGKKNLNLEQLGGLSPFTRMADKAVRVFEKLGFAVWDGGDIVNDFENFGALNFPDDHPAREMHDTFYVEQGYLLRTHTSTLQYHILKTKDFPIRAIVPGKCFRNEATDARHEAIFTQLEGIVVDTNITVTHLIATLELFLKEIFEEDVKTRIRPGYFPFVEPGLELEIHCLVCHGSGCRLCKGLGWIEVMPCGMIHPNVLKNAGVDPEKYSGFAFGFGLSRLTQLKYAIADCRLMYADDPKFLGQFQ
ncbi:phenylalanine--tRNA ligase subunit alpha [Candidatus Gracilibacteria bacterium CG17_big_fil_post_rev_8_21_14_2_50_48_13]|nr:MAG: phenylalanine--tRNA ligase subunit alpha [Candidatus Gracilibacteria bacterium CG17_big_fil_post_rev_8_21_14_2_50_48_13]